MLKIGVFGAGHLGKIHLRLLKDIQEFEIAGFYDSDLYVAEQVARETGLKSFKDEESLIDFSDAIDIVTPTVSHFDIAEKAIKKGKHVFIEKPLTNTVEEAKALIELAREAGIKAQVGHVERFNPAFLILKNQELNPMFIETHRLAEFNPRGTDVSVILDLMIHDIDIILSLVRSNVKSISASGVAVVSDTPDIANARIEFDNGCVANLTASRISMKNMRKTRLFQKDAYISIDFLEKKTEIVRLAEEKGINPFSFELPIGKSGKKFVAFERPEVRDVNAIRYELELFANAILKNTEPEVSLHDGYYALKIAHQIIKKIEKKSLI